MSPATGAAPPARTRPRLLVAVVLAGAAAALGMRFVGAGSDEPTTVGQLATPVTVDVTATPTATATPADPTDTTPGSATSTTAAQPATTVAAAVLPTIPWATGADGTRREPFAFTPVPEADPAAVGGAPTDTGAADDLSTGADDGAGAASFGNVPVPTAIGMPIDEGTDADGDATEGTVETTTTVPAETTTTRSPTLGLVTRSAGGYWLFQADGSVYASREGTWFGDLRAVALTSTVVGMQATPTGKGYYLVSRDGGVFAFGDAVYDGSIPETLARELEALLDDGYLAPTTTTAPAKHR